MKKHLLTAAAVLAVIALAVIGALALTGGHGTVTFQYGGPHGTATGSVAVPKSAANQAEAGLSGHEDMRSEDPRGMSQKQLDAVRAQDEALAANDQLPIVTPDAAPAQRGCTTRLVQDYSSRQGVKPREFVLHYTVSPNRPGWDDVNAVAHEFDTFAFQASSNYIVDNEGNCLYIVRETDKAWTQAAANPFSISVEVINTGKEPTYAGTKGLAKLGLIISDATKRWGIPLQAGEVKNCLVVKAGIIDHGALGACGGGHHDIAPYSVAQVIAAAKAFRASEAKPTLALPPVSAENAVCTVLNLNKRLAQKPATWKVTAGTRRAIKTVQRRYGIPQTGYAGAKVGRILHLKWCHV